MTKSRSIFLFESMRPSTLVQIFLAVGLATLMSFNYQLANLSWLEVFAMQMAAVMLVASQFLWNDMCDLELDVHKGVKRLIHFDHRTPYALILTLISCAIAFLTSVNELFIFIWAVLMLVLTWYSRVITKISAFAANIICSITTTVGVLSPMVAFGRYDLFWAFAPALTLMLLAREIIMDVTDDHADSMFRQNSLPQIIGKQKSVTAAIFLLLTVVPVSYLGFWLVGLASTKFIVLLSFAHILSGVSAYWLRSENKSLERHLTDHIKLSWLIYMAAFAMIPLL